MPRYIIDTENLTVTLIKDDETTEVIQAPKPDMVSLLQEHRGETEYNGVVADIQRWYYGSVVKAAWCATCVSYFANKAGILDQLGGKNENVNQMRLACMKARPTQYYSYVQVRDKSFLIKKGDILFWLWAGSEMTDGSSKHVGVAEYDSVNEDTVFCIGGNQKDKICTQSYYRASLYAVFRPVY